MHRLIFSLFFTTFAVSQGAIVRKWHCDNKFCVPVLLEDGVTQNTSLHESQELCRLVCGKNRGLWPVPYEIVELSDNYITFSMEKVSFDFQGVSSTLHPLLTKMTEIFKRQMRLSYKNLRNARESNSVDGRGLSIFFNVSNSSDILNWNTNESYILDVKSADTKNILAEITSETIFGARHALETLSQLIASQSVDDGLVILSKALIRDKPLYKHRGLLLDTSRNFLPLRHIRQTIMAMGAAKLNVFHWHLTDAQSFPFEVSRRPEMTQYGSYSPEKVYRFTDVRKIIEFAKLHGVQVLLEIDAPAHAGLGWQWGIEKGLGELAVCVAKEPWRNFCIQPPCGQLNPVNPNVSLVMRDIYQDLVDVNPSQVNFHMGGDEVHFGCWNSSKTIIESMNTREIKRNTEGFLQLWSDFQQRMLETYDSLVAGAPKVILWSSDLTNPNNIQKYLSPERYVIQTWVESEISLNKELLEKGYQLIISTKNAWYFDHGFWGTTSFYNWKKVYANKILVDEGVLGGEGCMWGEFVNQNSLHARVWPRAAALAERLWSDPIKFDKDEVETRLNAFTKRITALGLTPDAIRPEWCLMNEGKCPNYHP